jgi:hypothetical protein
MKFIVEISDEADLEGLSLVGETFLEIANLGFRALSTKKLEPGTVLLQFKDVDEAKTFVDFHASEEGLGIISWNDTESDNIEAALTSVILEQV